MTAAIPAYPASVTASSMWVSSSASIAAGQGGGRT